MPYPQPPEISTSYTAQEQALGDGSLPGQELDVDLAAVRTSVTELIEFVKLHTRSDGRLANASVTRDTLDSSLLIGFDPPAPWVSGVAYTTSSTVFEGFGFYLCTVAHTSGTFATDLAASRWVLLADLTPPGGALIASNNLSDVADVPNTRANLGLGTMATAMAGTGPAEFQTNAQNDADFFPKAGVSAFAETLLDDANAAGMRTTLELGSANTVSFGAINITGDIISDSAGSVEWQLDKGASGNRSRLWGETAGLGRWALDLGDATAESGSNAGSDFVVKRYNDAGTFLADAFAIRRNTGAFLIYNEITMVNDGKIAWNTNQSINVGTGTPEGAVTAPIGSLYLRADGSPSTAVYMKGTGTGNTGWVTQGYTWLTPQSTTSGTQFDFTGIPAGVTEIVVAFSGVSLSGTDSVLVQLGDSGGFETTGYSGAIVLSETSVISTSASSTSGFQVALANASNAATGFMQLYRAFGDNEWLSSANMSRGAQYTWSAQSKTLSDVLTQVRVTRSGSNTFDLGRVTAGYR